MPRGGNCYGSTCPMVGINWTCFSELVNAQVQ